MKVTEGKELLDGKRLLGELNAAIFKSEETFILIELTHEEICAIHGAMQVTHQLYFSPYWRALIQGQIMSKDFGTFKIIDEG